jgi:hypothetical protein
MQNIKAEAMGISLRSTQRFIRKWSAVLKKANHAACTHTLSQTSRSKHIW